MNTLASFDRYRQYLPLIFLRSCKNRKRASLEDVLQYDVDPRKDAERKDDIAEVQNFFFLNAVVEQADLNTPRTVTRLLSDLENAQILTLEREARGRSSALYAFRSLLKITESKQV
jgi:DNA-binding transcriptional ArsR family regulator